MEPEEKEDIEDHTPTESEEEEMEEYAEQMDWYNGINRL
jgi:hypothetical protein